MKRITWIAVLAVLAFAQLAFAGNTTTVSVAVAAESAINITTGTTSLTEVGGFASYTGSTNFTYQIRTTPSTGTGNVTLKVTTDFSPANGPSVATPPTAGDALTYTCTAAGSSSPTACSSAQTASTSSSTPVLNVGADAHSAFAGDSGSLGWALTNDPKYKVGTYTATVTFTISAT